MGIFKSMIIAFSIYSKIPMPQFPWKEEDMKYMLCFFPWVGAVIGGLLYGWFYVQSFISCGKIAYVSIGMALPLLITGGFHVDGFMDTMDAIHSYRSREEKLEILKDSHIGAFAVIMLALYGLIYMAAFSEIEKDVLMRMICIVFFIARCLSGLSVLLFPKAKKEGLAVTFSNGTEHKKSVIFLGIETFLGCMLLLGQSMMEGVFLLIVLFGIFAYYYKRSMKEFGGVTGDTSGWFLLMAECGTLVMAAILNHIM